MTMFHSAVSFVLFLLLSAPAEAQSINLDSLLPAGDPTASGRIVQLVVVLTVLSVAPGLLMMVTCFSRFLIAFSFLRAGLGLQTTPSNLILVSLSMFMTLFVMGPTFEQSWQAGVKPLIENRISQEEGFTQTTTPFRTFMMANVREKDLAMFEAIALEKLGADKKLSNEDFRILIPAFMISELRRGFEIGFLIALPFLVIDLVVATIVMSMGMMMLPPMVISLPLKVHFFVPIDRWNMLVGTLVRSFA